jgi:hypothetical protein
MNTSIIIRLLIAAALLIVIGIMDTARADDFECWKDSFGYTHCSILKGEIK